MTFLEPSLGSNTQIPYLHCSAKPNARVYRQGNQGCSTLFNYRWPQIIRKPVSLYCIVSRFKPVPVACDEGLDLVLIVLPNEAVCLMNVRVSAQAPGGSHIRTTACTILRTNKLRSHPHRDGRLHYTTKPDPSETNTS